MTMTQRRKAAIEDLFDRYYQRGDVDSITVSSIPGSTPGIHLLISCPSMHGMQRAHEALARADAPSQNSQSVGGDQPGGGGGAGGAAGGAGGGGGGGQPGGGGGGAGVGGGNSMLPSGSSQYLADTGETEEERRERHVVRCGVETVLQLAKFKQASVESSSSSVLIHAQYSNFLQTQFTAGPLLVTLCAKRQEGRSLGLLAALAAEIRNEPVFKAFEAAAVEVRLSG